MAVLQTRRTKGWRNPLGWTHGHWFGRCIRITPIFYSFTPPLWRELQSFKFATRIRPRLVYMVIVAKSYAWLQEPSQSAFRSVMIFVKYREVSTRTILPNFISNCGDSGGIGTRERKRKRVSRKLTSSKFWVAPLANLDNSPNQPE